MLYTLMKHIYQIMKAGSASLQKDLAMDVHLFVH